MKYTFNRIGQIQAVGFWIWNKKGENADDKSVEYLTKEICD